MGVYEDAYIRTNASKYPNWANFLNDFIYKNIGYDFLNTWVPDYYGSKINREIATTLSAPRAQAYDAAAKKLAEEYSKARSNVNISAMNRGLSKSGFTAEQERELAGQEAAEKSSIWANLLQQEQNFLDQLYMQNKDIALKVALQERNEALARQVAFTDFIKNAMQSNSDIAMTLLKTLVMAAV